MKKKGSFIRITVETEKDRKYKKTITIEESKPYVNATVINSAVPVPVKLLIDVGNSDAIWLFKMFL
jgi:hypothetical protein